jgi:hypothetical protein
MLLPEIAETYQLNIAACQMLYAASFIHSIHFLSTVDCGLLLHYHLEHEKKRERDAEEKDEAIM